LKGGGIASASFMNNNEGLNAAYLKQRSPFELTHRNTTSHHILLPTPIITTVKESCEGSELKEGIVELKRRVEYVLLCRVELSRVEEIIGWSTIDNERVDYLPMPY
jgi:hypothetical protein